MALASESLPPAGPDCTDNPAATAADDGNETDSLVLQLEAPTDDEDESGGDEHDGGGAGDTGGTNNAWPTLRYASYMTATYQFIKEKHKAQNYLDSALAKARKELGDNGDADVPVKRPTLEGDIEHYSIPKQITRRQNKKSPGFLTAVRMIWDATRTEMTTRLGTSLLTSEPNASAEGGVSGAGKVADDFDGIDKEAFVCLMIKVHYLIICPPIDREVAHQNACNDWVKDNADSGPIMNYDRFVASLFELVDLWTETLEAEEYDALAMTIAEGVTTKVKPNKCFLLKQDSAIVYNPKITKEPIYMEDVAPEENDADDEEDDAAQRGARGTGTGGKRQRKAAHKRFGGVYGFPKAAADSGELDDDGGAAVSSLAQTARASKMALMSTERVNATIAKIYFSKMQVDRKLLKRDGTLSWVERCRRKKDQRMDRFVLQYHIRQFGTKKLARRNLHQLCKSITRLALTSPRISVFAELTGVSVMVQKRPYAERMVEFRPFACSDFMIPMLTKLCPPEEKVDRWMGNGKGVPVAVTVADFMQAVKDICPDVPVECPAYVNFLIQIGRLADRLDERCRIERLNKPNAGRPSIDLDEGLMVAMPMWSAEEEYLIMKVTLNAIAVLKKWMHRWRRRRAERGTLPPIQSQRQARVTTARKTQGRNAKRVSSTTVEKPSSTLSSLAGVAREADAVESPRKLQESASSPARVLTTAAAGGAVTAQLEGGGGGAEDVDREGQKSDSTRARLRLEEAKALDKRVAPAQRRSGGA